MEWPETEVGVLDAYYQQDAGTLKAQQHYQEILRQHISNEQPSLPGATIAQVLKSLEQPAALAPMRQFGTGATRNVDQSKLDPEGFLHPLVLKRYCEYMHKHRVQADGNLRASDNWTKGIPQDAYAKSLWRHVLDVMLLHRGYKAVDPNTDEEEALCAVMFNAMGKLHEVLLKRNVK